MTNPVFIVLEGDNGSGKTTQRELVAAALTEYGHQVVVTEEPSASVLGRQVREIVGSNPELDPKTRLFLFEAARVEHCRMIRGWLADGKTVVCDRFYHSTLAFQSVEGLHLPDLYRLNAYAVGEFLMDSHRGNGLHPDHVFWFDIPPELARGRALAKAGGDALDTRPLSFYQSVREMYVHIWQTEKNVYQVDATGSVEAVTNRIVGYLKDVKVCEEKMLMSA